ncbi:MAG TPA: S1C family serine protease, partial [Tepidisphaeraceae bacterium]|nr:S1C family serine protease [Tepidisphaeraceae bacterium]
MTLRTLLAIAVLGIAPLSLSAQTTAPSTRPAFEPTPASLDELRSIERDVGTVLEKVMPSVVGVQVGGSQGSGVIVSRDGFVLTAGHVSGPAGQQCTIILEGGRRVRGITLGRNSSIDSGMIRITDPGDYPAAEMGISVALVPGQWVIALGHPGGSRPGRPPVVRLVRVLNTQDSLIITDNTLVGGD